LGVGSEQDNLHTRTPTARPNTAHRCGRSRISPGTIPSSLTQAARREPIRHLTWNRDC